MALLKRKCPSCGKTFSCSSHLFETIWNKKIGIQAYIDGVGGEFQQDAFMVWLKKLEEDIIFGEIYDR